ncbi:type II toxin-antitoxin system Phd/YefM family antitoxin [Synechocystis sp. PCC 7339]|nr:type II toxin-antitoxin system Phd/YefM family antitoxin [Synechocystis sp. PCC 7338]UAJ74510.1 type II toxin-antitoxin system Phd/YefM family antitoxin [Synechocystis sp. PCC 7339]
MEYLSLPEVEQNFDNLINKIAEDHQPITVKGSQNEVVILLKEYWAAIQDTIYLNSIPGYVDSVHQAIHSSREEWVNATELGL